MRNLEKILENRKIDKNKLLKYGFQKIEEGYYYQEKIYQNQFIVEVSLSENEKTARLIDLANEEEYILVDVEESTGEFVGKVKQEYENKLEDIIQKCTIVTVFHEKQSNEVIRYIRKKYGDELEFLWKKFDGTAIWRNKSNQKWYGILMKISKSKLGLASNEIMEVIDLRYQKERIEEIVDNKKVYSGYHMNKKSWITIVLDESLDITEINRLIDNSYQLAIGNKCGLSSDSLAQKVYDYLRLIPKGKVVTYQQVAKHLGNKGLARVVGNILHKNPDGDKYPCYKVLNSKGELAEAFVFGGKNVQKERLERDGIRVNNDKVDLAIYQWKEEKF